MDSKETPGSLLAKFLTQREQGASHQELQSTLEQFKGKSVEFLNGPDTKVTFSATISRLEAVETEDDQGQD